MGKTESAAISKGRQFRKRDTVKVPTLGKQARYAIGSDKTLTNTQARRLGGGLGFADRAVERIISRDKSKSIRFRVASNSVAKYSYKSGYHEAFMPTAMASLRSRAAVATAEETFSSRCRRWI